MRQGPRKLATIFKALSEDIRLIIVGLLIRHDHLCVCEVERILDITQSKASRHLRYLRNAGILEDERDGLIVNYRLPREPDPELSAILKTLRPLLAEEVLPDAASLLVQLRSTRRSGEMPGTRNGEWRLNP